MSYYLSSIGNKYEELVSINGETVNKKKRLYSEYKSNTDEEYSIDSICNNFGIDKEKIRDWYSISTLPYDFYRGSTVVYNNEIHILGGAVSDNGYKQYVGTTYHYKFNKNTNSWSEVSTLPYNFCHGSAIVYNDEIHILGGYNGNGTSYPSATFRYHYKLNKNTGEWEEVSTLPSSILGYGAIVYNNEIHIVGGIYDFKSTKRHFKYDGTSWSELTNLPFSSGFNTIIYNNEIHSLGGINNKTVHYKYNGTSWTSVSTLPYDLDSYSGICIYKNEIHCIMSSTSSTTIYKHYKWNGSSWIYISDDSFTTQVLVVYDNEIHSINNYITGNHHHYAWGIKTPHIFIEYKDE